MRVVLLAFLLLLPLVSRAADRLAQVEEKLASATPAERPALLVELSDAVEATDLGRALAAAEEARRTAKVATVRLAAQAVVASINRQRANYPVAMELANAGLAEANALGDDALRARFHYIIARTQWSLADYPAAVASFHESIRFGQKAGDLAVLSDAHSGIITIYTEFKQTDEALPHIDAARRCAEQLGDPRRLADFYRVYGNHLGQRKDQAGARAAHERSRQISAESGNIRGVADALQNIGYIDEITGLHEVARAQYAEAIAIYEKLDLKRHLINAHRQLGRVLGRMGRTDEALQHMDTSLTLARRFGGQVAIANLYRDRAIVYEAAGNLKAALDDQRELHTQNETIFGERVRQQVALLTARFDNERHQHEIDLLKRDQALKDAELARAQWQRYSLIGALALGGVAVGALVSRQRLKLASERRLLEETRAARDAAEAADRFKTRLVGIASHDLKSPVNALIGGAVELQRVPADARTVAELGRLMETESRRMMALVRNLLDLAALESGRLELECAPISLAEVAREGVDLFQARARGKSQTLVCTVTPEAGAARVFGDHARLRQVFDNLLDNALKFTPSGKRIDVEVARTADSVRVAVRDEGPGLSPEDYVRMFGAFQKLSARPTGGEASSGLGLSIAREIVTLHRGQLIVDSVPGAGATFAFEIPVSV